MVGERFRMPIICDVDKKNKLEIIKNLKHLLTDIENSEHIVGEYINWEVVAEVEMKPEATYSRILVTGWNAITINIRFLNKSTN